MKARKIYDCWLSDLFPSSPFFTHCPETSPSHVGTCNIKIFESLYPSGTGAVLKPWAVWAPNIGINHLINTLPDKQSFLKKLKRHLKHWKIYHSLYMCYQIGYNPWPSCKQFAMSPSITCSFGEGVLPNKEQQIIVLTTSM